VFVYLLQLREAARGHPETVIFFAVFSTIVWLLWALKTGLSRRYKPWTAAHNTTASVIVPVVDEPLDLFRDVLQRILKQDPHEVIVVVNGKRNLALEEICGDLGVTWRWTATPGKRNAVRVGTEIASGEILVLVDSDTIWTDDTLPELLKPFADPAIGGVTTKQRILQARGWNGELPGDTTGAWRRRRQLAVARYIRRWTDWMENSRARYSMPAQSTLGQVGCLPGRTIAFRRSVVVAAMHDFMTQRFLGVFLEVSDDRTLTNLTLKQGYRTAYQSTSLVYTDAPTRFRKLYKQQLRWARGSQYNTLRMLPWMITHTPVLALFFLCDIALPFVFLGCVIAWAYRAWRHSGINLLEPTLEAFPGPLGWAVAGSVIAIGSSLSMWLRQLRHLHDEPRDWAWMPIYILFSSFFLMPIRLMGFFRMAHAAAWGTRQDSYAGERRLNPKALIPYLLGALVIGAEVALITHT
jgi:cellulose synthase/poly-beta-1,6-N-acetylglucosamine synthase-like glycosyltransferase